MIRVIPTPTFNVSPTFVMPRLKIDESIEAISKALARAGEVQETKEIKKQLEDLLERNKTNVKTNC